MSTPASRPAFDAQQLALLRVNLGRHYDQVQPALAHAIGRYHGLVPSDERDRRHGRRHRDAAARLQRASRHLQRVLAMTTALIADAFASHFIPPDHCSFQNCTLSDLAALTPRWLPGEAAQRAIHALIEDAHTWQSRAHAMARGKPGQGVGNRIRLCAWIGAVLSHVGLPLSTRPTAVWGQVYALTCEAAGIRLRADLGRDLRKARAILRPH